MLIRHWYICLDELEVKKVDDPDDKGSNFGEAQLPSVVTDCVFISLRKF